MPLSSLFQGSIALKKEDPEYFKSLEEFDSYEIPAKVILSGFGGLRGVGENDSAQKPKLMICHDYKGGYKDNPTAPSYTFNFWSLCDTFIYFAHHRISPPPRSWTTSAHGHGSKILGTLIFEPGSGEADCLQLLTGPVATVKPGQVLTYPKVTSDGGRTFSLSNHYARRLAELAASRGFDGYLLNFEVPLAAGEEHARLLGGWISLLQKELKSLVGLHAEVVCSDGKIDCYAFKAPENHVLLTFHGAPKWPPQFPKASAQYFDTIGPQHRRTKSRRDIYIGIDVWGRGTHGGGGFNSYKAIEHIEPTTDGLGLSVAIFGQGWTWESKQDKPGWSWAKWWNDEMDFWRGSTHIPSEPDQKPPPDPRHQPCKHGPFRSIGFFFDHRPITVDRPFFTTFSPGIGHAWFVEGLAVANMASGWTDVDKQTPIGDQVWPSPMIILSEDQDAAAATVSVSFAFDDAWLGGSSLLFDILLSDLDLKPLQSTDPPAPLAYIPVQSLLLNPAILYSVQITRKVEPCTSYAVETLPFILLSDGTQCEVALDELEIPINDWVSRSGFFTLPSDAEAVCSIGMAMNLVELDAKSVTSELPLRVHLGLASVKPLDSIAARPVISVLKWTPAEHADSRDAHAVSGSLEWQNSVTVPFNWRHTASSSHLQDKSDPVPQWTFEEGDSTPHARWYPLFAYHNIFLQLYSSEDRQATFEKAATFVGTTDRNSPNILSFNEVAFYQDSGATYDKVRVYLRGVYDNGSVVPWIETPFIDIPIS